MNTGRGGSYTYPGSGLSFAKYSWSILKTVVTGQSQHSIISKANLAKRIRFLRLALAKPEYR
jgi:hypothetical protein